MTEDQKLQALTIIRNILAGKIDPERISIVRRVAYHSVVYDGYAARPLCRFYQRGHTYTFSIHDERKVELCWTIDQIAEINLFKNQLINRHVCMRVAIAIAEMRKTGKKIKL